MLNLSILQFQAVLQPEVSYVDVSGFCSSRGATVLLKLDGALIVLFKYFLAEFISLGFHEHFNPNGVWEVVTCAHEFRFSGALGVKFLPAGFTYETTTPKRDDSTGVAAHV